MDAKKIRFSEVKELLNGKAVAADWSAGGGRVPLGVDLSGKQSGYAYMEVLGSCVAEDKKPLTVLEITLFHPTTEELMPTISYKGFQIVHGDQCYEHGEMLAHDNTPTTTNNLALMVDKIKRVKEFINERAALQLGERWGHNYGYNSVRATPVTTASKPVGTPFSPL